MTPFKGRNRVTSAYGWRTLRGARQWHAGQDIVGDDKRVRAIWDAMRCETSTGWNGGRGNMVTLYYSAALRVICQHLAEIYVKNGQMVRQGQEIGWMGNTGDSLGAHLHIEVQRYLGGKWEAIPPAEYTEVPNTVGSHPGNDRLDRAAAPEAESVPTAQKTLAVGPVSAGDRDAFLALAKKLVLGHKLENLGGGLSLVKMGPMTAGDEKTVKNLAGELKVEVV